LIKLKQRKRFLVALSEALNGAIGDGSKMRFPCARWSSPSPPRNRRSSVATQFEGAARRRLIQSASKGLQLIPSVCADSCFPRLEQSAQIDQARYAEGDIRLAELLLGRRELALARLSYLNQLRAAIDASAALSGPGAALLIK
jgi:hypothetical protein